MEAKRNMDIKRNILGHIIIIADINGYPLKRAARVISQMTGMGYFTFSIACLMGYFIIGMPHAMLGALTYKNTRALKRAIWIGGIVLAGIVAGIQTTVAAMAIIITSICWEMVVYALGSTVLPQMQIGGMHQSFAAIVSSVIVYIIVSLATTKPSDEIVQTFWGATVK